MKQYIIRRRFRDRTVDETHLTLRYERYNHGPTPCVVIAANERLRNQYWSRMISIVQVKRTWRIFNQWGRRRWNNHWWSDKRLKKKKWKMKNDWIEWWTFTKLWKALIPYQTSQNVKYLQRKSRESAEKTERVQRREQQDKWEKKISSVDWIELMTYMWRYSFIHKATTTRAWIELTKPLCIIAVQNKTKLQYNCKIQCSNNSFSWREKSFVHSWTLLSKK